MIALLRGVLIHKQAPDLVLDVNGVGYEMQASMTTFLELPELQQETTLFTHFIVREDAQTLYAFSTVAEREFFRALLRINGVGPKMALAIVSSMTLADFSAYIRSDNITALTKIPGVGKKTAERLIIEMRDRIDALAPALESENTAGLAQGSAPLQQRDKEEEAVNALLALGYKPTQASKMVAGIANQADSTEDMIRLALKSSLK
jgi:Holliday junction DNA helicase RuvA